MPPRDLAAEQCVLGAMLLSKDAIADVVEAIRAADFYRPAHEMIFNAILDLYGRGEPSDAITVSNELTKRGELPRSGGLMYLHTLLSIVLVATNAQAATCLVVQHPIPVGRSSDGRRHIRIPGPAVRAIEVSK